MAVDSVMVARMARLLALAHILVGFLLICFGIADRVGQHSVVNFIGFGIWIGVWVSSEQLMQELQLQNCQFGIISTWAE